MKILGVILIIVGLAMVFVRGFDFTTQEKVIDAGPIQVSADKNNEVSWPTYAGGIVAAVGLGLILIGKKK